MWKYAFTVKRNDIRYPLPEDYFEWFDHVKENGFYIKEWYYEVDKLNKLHIHGLAEGKPFLYYKTLKTQGMHQCIKQLPSDIDLKRWCTYIKKDQNHMDVHNYIEFVTAKIHEELEKAQPEEFKAQFKLMNSEESIETD